jgi:hypothetical protein
MICGCTVKAGPDVKGGWKAVSFAKQVIISSIEHIFGQASHIANIFGCCDKNASAAQNISCDYVACWFCDQCYITAMDINAAQG